MSTIRQELADQIDKLDEEQQRQLLEYALMLMQPRQLTWTEWLEKAEQAQADLRAKYGDQHYFNSQSLLDEVRQERLDDLLGSY